MQALSQRQLQQRSTLRAAKSAAVFRSAVPARTGSSPHAAASVVVKAAATFDVAEFGDDVDLSLSQDTVAPLATENVRLRIRMRGYSSSLLAEAVEQIHAISETTGATFKGPVMLPTHKRLYCVLRSPHVNKDAREHFEIKVHHRCGLGKAFEGVIRFVHSPKHTCHSHPSGSLAAGRQQAGMACSVQEKKG